MFPVRRPAALIASLAVIFLSPSTAEAAPPANDNFANATTYPKPGVEVGSNVEATRQTGEPSNGDATIWWKWTPTESGRYRLDDCETVPELGTVLGVYTGNSVSSLTEVAVNPNFGGCDNSNMEALAFDALAGTTYRLSVGSTSSTTSSNVRLSLRRTELNDNFASALLFDPVPGTVVGTNADATRETGEPETGSRTVWWRWTAGETARYRLDDCETVPELGTVLGVYTGDSVSSLVEVVSNSNGGGCAGSNMESVFFDAVAGTAYRFSVGSSSNVSSSNLRVSLRRTALNDNFATAFRFDPAPGTVTGTNVEATRETGEPNNGERTVWWSWTAPGSARYSLDDCQTDPAFSTVLGVYTGEAVTSLQQVPTEAGQCPSTASGGLRLVFFNATAGTTYHFSVGSSSSTSSPNIRLRLDRPVTPACAKATADLAAATTASKNAKKRTAKAKAALKRANRALRKARGRAAKARARSRVRTAKRKLNSAKGKQRKANAALATATATHQARC
jgi:hypothetical protein